MKRINQTALFLTFFIYLVAGNSYAQNWDYDPFPRADLDLTHLDAEITIEDDGQIRGNILYSASLKNSYTDSIFFDAAGLDIESVTINDEETEFLLQDLQLVILPEQTFLKDDEIRIGIRYTAAPSFGVHNSQKGTLWTSFLPKTTRHWLPVVDSPRISLATDFIITHPAGTTVVSNGRVGISEVVNTEYERTIFSTEQPVPASSIGWALFDEVATASTIESGEIRDTYTLFSRRSAPQIYVYSESDHDPENELQVAARKINQIAGDSSIPALSDDLHIVILEDDFLETKQSGGGLLFVYENKGDISNQIERGIVSLYAESFIQAPTWSDADAARLTEAYFMNRFGNEISIGEPLNPPYNVYSENALSGWMQYLENDSSEILMEGLNETLRPVSENRSRTEGWTEFAKRLYDITGRSWNRGLEFSLPESSDDDTVYTYSVVIDWEEGSTNAEIRLEADDLAIDELVTVSAEVIGLSSTQVREFTFSGASDGVVLNVPSTLENIVLSVKERNDVVFETEKPFLFWMVQLRDGESVERRAEAAAGISSYRDNPDIELLLNDILRGEESARVVANILQAMAVVTDGASGTDERFLQFTGSQYDISIRTAAIDALGNYEGNERVISRLRGLIRQEAEDSVRKTALNSLAEIVDRERFVDIAGSMISNEIIGDLLPDLLNNLAEKGAEEEAAELADQAFEIGLPFTIAQETVQFLISIDQSPANWEQRLPGLMNQPHPGVRLAAAEALSFLPADSREDFLETVLSDEFDERVRRALLENR